MVIPPPNSDGRTAGFIIIRPECIEFADPNSQNSNLIEITILNDYFLGSKICYVGDYKGTQIIIERPREERHGFQRGNKIKISWKVSDSHFVES